MIRIWPRLWRTFVLLLALAGVLVVTLLAGCSGSSAATPAPAPVLAQAAATPRPSVTATPSGRSTATATPTRSRQQKIDGLQIIRLKELPPEALDTLRLIARDGPFPYTKDGATFQNREGILPRRPSGYYREYTVITPGENDRGVRRIVTGENDEYYYSDDHYDSFKRIVN